MSESSPAARFPAAALFDLDGTLLDSAPDMLATVNRMLASRDRPPLTLSEIRPVVSRGARAMASAAFSELDTDGVTALVPEFLAVYAEELGRHSVLFDGVEAMLAALEAAGTPWGIVTNKPEYLAVEILPQLGWQDRCAVLIGGDTLAERKPHPLPLLHAADAIGIAPAGCVYVGDDARDIAAARAAGMGSVVALWGYRVDDDDPRTWQGDVMLDAVQALVEPAGWPQR
ncbi:phosphoglycolate phosphatase [Luteimonas fraxinea]|uniref:phosphoglycolate phosphatase n=1 Tax=Luteimonas fraxinea TaxID=2901869 RepID=UPI001E519A48|nr:phosphoglycolate phosphatase [Luteimonas fraxinea]MCD9125948.1 phosphoglycolate phosphatase [Luteimonas fraxinea]